MAATLWSTRKWRKDWPRHRGHGGRRWVWLDVGSGLELISSYSGINDAPALTAADVGIAVASGSDVAISSASFILLTSDLRSLVTLRDLARTTIRRVKFNFVSILPQVDFVKGLTQGSSGRPCTTRSLYLLLRA